MAMTRYDTSSACHDIGMTSRGIAATLAARAMLIRQRVVLDRVA